MSSEEDFVLETIEIEQRILEGMIDHAQAEYPLECCGLFSGVDPLIDAVTPTDNLRRSRCEFFIVPKDLFAFLRRVRSESKHFLGIYHSHISSPAFPSERDIAEFHYHDVSYWIISLEEPSPDVRCFVWRESGFREIRFKTKRALS